MVDVRPAQGTPVQTVPAGAEPPMTAVREAVTRALEEDCLPMGDLTASLIDPGRRATMVMACRSAGVVAGRLCAVETFRQVDPLIEVDWRLPDGSTVGAGDVLAEVRGPMHAILTAERTALNFCCHLSGIASATRRIVDAVAATNPSTRVLDTRKTLPGLRAMQKAAVRAGGGANHRGSLSEGVLIKDNHLGGLAIADAVRLAKVRWPGRMVEVECDREAQAVEAAGAGAGIVMLDNMDPGEVARVVPLVRSAATGDVLVEVSGGITAATAPRYAAAGADLLSVGALTHSAVALDIGLDLVAR